MYKSLVTASLDGVTQYGSNLWFFQPFDNQNQKPVTFIKSGIVIYPPISRGTQLFKGN